MEDMGGRENTGTAEKGESAEDDLRENTPLLRRLKFLLYAVTGADNRPEMFKLELEPSDEATIKRLNKRAKALVEERAGLRMWRALIVISTAVIPVTFLLLVPAWENGAPTLSGWNWKLGACLAFLEFFLLVLLLFVRARVANLGAQLVILEYEKVLTSFDGPHERRAADLFFKHQAELKQYYDQTLRQNRQSFIVGLFCIAFGLAAIIAVATLLLNAAESNTTAKLVAGGLGILSVLLTGFVARIYLRVYEGSADALGSFHERLVNTNDYHFASLVISMIEPKQRRMVSQSELASAITTPRTAAEFGD